MHTKKIIFLIGIMGNFLLQGMDNIVSGETKNNEKTIVKNNSKSNKQKRKKKLQTLYGMKDSLQMYYYTASGNEKRTTQIMEWEKDIKERIDFCTCEMKRKITTDWNDVEPYKDTVYTPFFTQKGFTQEESEQQWKALAHLSNQKLAYALLLQRKGKPKAFAVVKPEGTNVLIYASCFAQNLFDKLYDYEGYNHSNALQEDTLFDSVLCHLNAKLKLRKEEPLNDQEVEGCLLTKKTEKEKSSYFMNRYAYHLVPQKEAFKGYQEYCQRTIYFEKTYEVCPIAIDKDFLQNWPCFMYKKDVLSVDEKK